MTWQIQFEPLTGFDLAQLLARCLQPWENIPGLEETRLAASATLPAELMQKVNSIITGDTLAKPWIFPREITIDGGADYRSSTFASACRIYGINVNLAPPGTPTVKPHVERMFGTIAREFSEWLPGATGNHVANKGENAEAIWDLAAVDMLFALWVTTVYHSTPHRGLRDPLCPSRCWSPNQKYAALFRVGPGIQIPFGPDDYIKLMPCVRRMVNRLF